MSNSKVQQIKSFKKETRFYNDIAITTGRIKFYIKPLLAADVFFTQTWVYKNNRWLLIGWQGTMTGQPKNYPIYVTVLVVMIVFGVVLLITAPDKIDFFLILINEQ